MYKIIFSEEAKEDLKLLQKRAPKAISKLAKLLEDIAEHPKTGIGKVEQLIGFDGTVYSRRITKEHRIVYKIYDDVVEVLVLSTFGHYSRL